MYGVRREDHVKCIAIIMTVTVNDLGWHSYKPEEVVHASSLVIT